MRDVSDAEKIIIDYCNEQIGCSYIFGAQGQKCTTSFRKEKSNQYPEYKSKIYNNCPRLSSGRAACTGCKWASQEGLAQPSFDCEGLVLRAMEKVGLKLPSGATSQYNKKTWQLESGTIDNMPKDRVCVVYRADGNKKAHTGVWLGSNVGYVVHAKGHDYGVIKQTLESYGRWTHYVLPALPENDDLEVIEVLYKAYVTSTNAKLNMRSTPSSSGTRLLQIPPLGMMDVIEESSSDWIKVIYDGTTGYVMKKFTTKVEEIKVTNSTEGATSNSNNKKTYYVKIEAENEEQAKLLVSLLKTASVGE